MLYGPCQPVSPLCPSAEICSDGSAFDSVYVVPRVAGGSTVYWSLRPNHLKSPIALHLQVSRTGHATADDWESITVPQVNISQAVDTVRRTYGWYNTSHYRVVATDSQGTQSFSKPVGSSFGQLPHRQFRDYLEIVRREQKRYQLPNSPASRGVLLKVRYYGEPCDVCIDPDSGQQIKDHCSSCHGVGYVGGYHEPIPCFNADLGPVQEHLSLYDEQSSLVTGNTTSLRYLNLPPVRPWDVWVELATDYRYLVGKISPITTFGGHNVLCIAAVARLSLDHPVYDIQVQ